MYGGSVFPETAKQLLSLENNSGIFVGRGALNADFFIQMLSWAIEISKTR
ncbi:MAG: triose-phosphate isomerase [Candidatus Humimicrobiaceae bacterium]